MAKFTGSAALIFDGGNNRIYDIEFAESTKLVSSGDSLHVDHCWLYGTDGLELTGGDYCKLSDTTIDVTNVAVSHNGSGEIYSLLVDNCNLLGSHGISEDSTGEFSELHIANSLLEVSNSAVTATAERLSIVGCSMHDGSGTAVVLTNNALGNRVHISDNKITNFDAGVYVNNLTSGGLFIHDNFIDSMQTYGLTLDDVDNGHVHNNYFQAISAGSVNGYDAINLGGSATCDDNMIHHNTVIPDSNTRYGVNVSNAVPHRTVVVGNNLGGTASYGTLPFNNSGTATVTSYPADATYGDNFVV